MKKVYVLNIARMEGGVLDTLATYAYGTKAEGLKQWRKAVAEVRSQKPSRYDHEEKEVSEDGLATYETYEEGWEGAGSECVYLTPVQVAN